jgi:hypothetical protein
LKYWPVAVMFLYFNVANNLIYLNTLYLGTNVGFQRPFMGIKRQKIWAEDGEKSHFSQSCVIECYVKWPYGEVFGFIGKLMTSTL